MNKLQRHDVLEGVYGQYSEVDDTGDWCKSEDAEQLEQQNAKLIEALEDFVSHQEFRESIQGCHGSFEVVYNKAIKTLAEVKCD